jgi:hypothetical protein
VSIEELATIARDLPVPQIANMVFGGLTPSVSQAELAKMGFGAVLYANAALQAALKSVREVLGSLKQNGSLDACGTGLRHSKNASEPSRRTTTTRLKPAIAIDEGPSDEAMGRYHSAARAGGLSRREGIAALAATRPRHVLRHCSGVDSVSTPRPPAGKAQCASVAQRQRPERVCGTRLAVTS